jgi:hypothetical protein
MQNACRFLDMAIAPDNGEKDRPLFCGGFIYIDQLKPNPANNPGGKKDDTNYVRHFRDLRVVLQVPTYAAGVAITTVLDEMMAKNEPWDCACEYQLDDDKVLKDMKGQFVTVNTEDTMKILYGNPKKQTIKRPTKQELQGGMNTGTGTTPPPVPNATCKVTAS